MIPALAYVAAAIWLAQVAMISHLIRTRPAPNLPPPPPVEPPPPLEPAGLSLGEMVRLDDCTDAYLRELHAQLADDSYDEVVERCLHCGGRV
jgi:hypothetical protein